MINYHKILGFYGATSNTGAICETIDNGLLIFATKESLLKYIDSKPNLRTRKVSPKKLSFEKAIAVLKANNKIAFELEAYKRFNTISKENNINLPEPSIEELNLLKESKWPLVLVENSNAI
jgi:hypothetical protein